MEHQQRYREKHMSDSNARGMGSIFSNRRDERMTELDKAGLEAAQRAVAKCKAAFRNSSAGELEWRDVSVTEEN